MIAALPLPLLLATLGSFGASSGVMTRCTNAYSCTVTTCHPCRAADLWLDAGWITQGVLLLIGVASAALGARRVRPRTVRLGALLLTAGSPALFIATTWLALHSF